MDTSTIIMLATWFMVVIPLTIVKDLMITIVLFKQYLVDGVKKILLDVETNEKEN